MSLGTEGITAGREYPGSPRITLPRRSGQLPAQGSMALQDASSTAAFEVQIALSRTAVSPSASPLEMASSSVDSSVPSRAFQRSR